MDWTVNAFVIRPYGMGTPKRMNRPGRLARWLPLFAALCTATIPNPASPMFAQGTAPRAGTGRNNETENPVVTEESDRARELAAGRAASRVVATLLRGPYLQSGSPDKIVVRWRTDRMSPSTVRFGLSETNLKYLARSRGLHTEHVVVLTNLLSDTRYFYALSTNLLAGTNTLNLTNLNLNITNSLATDTNVETINSTNRLSQTAGRGGGGRGGGRNSDPPPPARNVFHTNVLRVLTNSFVTAPPVGTPKPIRIWVLGDSGTRTPVQKQVRDGFAKFNGDRPIDLWLMLGDNAYTSGTDEEYQGAVFLAYSEQLARSVLWPAPG